MVSSIDDPLPVAIYALGKALTKVLRKGSKDYDDFIRVPPIKLGFWLIDNWWRIRWECRPLSVLTAEWQMVHDISSIGGGYPWPELTLWGEDDQIGINVVGDSADEIGAVRFITSGTFHIQAADFQESVTQFIDKLASDRSKYSNDHDILKDQFATWQSEMNDPEVSAWRRMEARLGYNPDTAPDDLMAQMSILESTYGSRYFLH